MRQIFFLFLFIAIANGLGDDELTEAKVKCNDGDKIFCYKAGMHYLQAQTKKQRESYLKNLNDDDDITYQKYAIDYMKKSCNLENGEACMVLGLLYDYNLNSKTSNEILSDEKESFKYLTKSCDKYNVKEGCISLVRKYQYKFEDEKDKNLKEEYKIKIDSYNKKACDLGHKQSCHYK